MGMKLLISKIDESGKTQLSVKFTTPKGEEVFDYIKLIEHLYHKPLEEIKLSYSDNVTDEEKNKIQEMFDDIIKEAQKTKVESTENKEN